MANTPSARKRIRQTEKRNARNTARRPRVRTSLRQAFQPEMMRAVTKGVLHANTVGRKLSRLSARVKALGATAQG